MNSWVRNRTTIGILAGFVVGLLVGAVLVGNNADLRDSLFGTAGGDKKEADFTYYLVDLDTAQAWLAEQYPDSAEEVKQAVDVIAKLPTAISLKQGLADAKQNGDVDAILLKMYAALVGAEDYENVKVDADNEVSACLGKEDDLFGDVNLLLYLTIPNEQVEKVGIPDVTEWKKLDKSMSSVLYWELLACFPEIEED
jgi:hypothetical protein